MRIRDFSGAQETPLPNFQAGSLTGSPLLGISPFAVRQRGSKIKFQSTLDVLGSPIAKICDWASCTPVA